MTTISIVICVYNNSALTRACLDSLHRHVGIDGIEVIVADDASTDDTPQSIPSAYPWVRYLRSEVNRGYGPTCTSAGLEARGDVLLLLNNDTEASDDFLGPLLKRLESSPLIGMVGSRLLYPDGTLQHAGMAFNSDLIPYHLYRNFAADFPAALKARSMPVLTGASVVIPRRLFIELQGFTPGFRNGFEDVDQCLRLGELGYSIWYEPASCLVHHEGKAPRRTAFEDENRALFLQRWRDRLKPTDADVYAEDHFPASLQPHIDKFRSHDWAALWFPLVWHVEAGEPNVSQIATELRDVYGLEIEQHPASEGPTTAILGGSYEALQTRITIHPTGANQVDIWSWPDLLREAEEQSLTLAQVLCLKSSALRSPDTLMQRGRSLLHSRSDMGEFVAQFAQMFPSAHEPHLLAGDWHWLQGDSNKALGCYQLACKVVTPRYVALRMARAFHRQGRKDEAQEHLNALLAINPYDIQARWLRVRWGGKRQAGG